MNAQQRALVKATVPLLESSGEALTRHFYKGMLNEYPEGHPLFNQANQGSGDQSRALANDILMYAKHLDHLETLGPLVMQISNKHVAPEHYPIIGTCLLRAIREVLGEEIATDEVLEAWGNAYGFLANLLIEAEDAKYAANAQAEGSWRGARPFVVARKVLESKEITSFYFEPEDGRPVLAHQPGQYICLLLKVDSEQLHRTYSLPAGSNGRDYRISVKREPGGMTSNYLHDEVQVGDCIELFVKTAEGAAFTGL